MKTTNFFTKLFNKTKICCSNEPGIDATPINVRLCFPGVQTFELNAKTTTDLYEVIRYFAITNCKTDQLLTPNRICDLFTIFYNEKPLSKQQILLREYNIIPGSTLLIKYYGLWGGCKVIPPKQDQQILLPTYEIVMLCEQQLLRKLRVQSDFTFSSMLGNVGTLFGDSNTPDLFGEISDDFTHKLIEDLLLFVTDLIRSKNRMDYTISVITFLKLRSGKALTTRANVELFTNFIGNLFPNELEVQSADDIFSGIRNYMGKFEELRKSPVFKKIYQLGLFAMSFSLLDKVGISFNTFNFSQLESEAIKQKLHLGPSLIYSMLSSLVFLCERGYQCFKTGSLDPIYHSGSQYEKWFDTAMILKNKATLLFCPEAHGFSLFEFLADLREAIEKGDAIFKHAVRMGANEKRLVSSTLSELKMILANQTTKREAQKERTAPFGICLYGGSSIGKTTITDMLFFQYGKTFNLPIESEFKFTRNPNAKFWDGFNSSQWFVIQDDIAFMNPNIASTGDPSVMETIQTMNRVAFVPDQASLEDKGRTPFKARCVVATTNCEDLNAVHYFQTPLAMQRRFPFTISVTVKEEYAKDVCMLDSSLTPPLKPGQWPNYWIFTIKRPVPIVGELRGQRAKLEIVATYDTSSDFLAWFSREAKKHEHVQKLVENSSNTMKDIVICEECFYPKDECKCLSVQTRWTFEDSFKYYALHGSLRVIQSPMFPKLVQVATKQPCVVKAIESKMFPQMAENVKIPALLTNEPMTSSRALNTLELACMTDEDHDAPPHLTTRQRFKQLGDKVRASIGWPELLACTIAACGFALGAYKTYSALSGLFSPAMESQAEVTSKDIGSAPIPTDDEKPNVWHRDTFELSTFEVSPQTLSFKALPRDQLIKILRNNIVSLNAIKEKDGQRFANQSRALCIGGHIYITNSHNIPEQDCELKIVTNEDVEGINGNTVMRLSNSLVHRFPNDLCAFSIPSLPPRRDIRNLFTSRANRAIMKGFMLQRTLSGKLETIEVANYHRKGQVAMDRFTISEGWACFPERPTISGECGAVHIGESGMGPLILGLHVAGNDQCSISTVVSKETIEEVFSKFQIDIIEPNAPVLSSQTAPREITELDKKSPFRWMAAGTAAVYGSFTGWRSTRKSDVKPSFIQDAVLEEGYTIKHDKPVMSGYEPWRIAALDMVKPVTGMDLAVLDKCKESFIKDILTSLPKGALKGVKVYDNVTTLNGAPGVAFVDQMNRNTSMGAPWRKGKKHYLEPLPATEEYPDAVEFVPEVMDRVENIIKGYIAGKRYMPVFSGQLKDEALPFKKIEAKKTRVFTGAPADWSFVVRKYLLSVIRLIQTNKFVFETAVGTNAASTQWQEIRNYLTQHNEHKMIAGDYGRFDKTMPPAIILASYDIIKQICAAAGYDSDALRVVQGIAEDTAFPLVDFNGDLVEFFGSNPSGHPLTVIINSLANALYMRYCYSKLSPDQSCENFKRDVALITYGDDNAMGVSERAPFFTHTTIQATLKDCGITYTMADKEQASIPYIHIDQISFLKRFWRYDVDVGAYVAPLEEDSISKALTVSTASKTLCPEAQAVFTMIGAHNEYFFHGREVFEAKAAMFQRIIKKKNLEAYITDGMFQPWDALVDRFWSHSQ